VRLRWDSGTVVAEAPGTRGPGRGAYLCAKMTCWETARRRRALGRALRRSGGPIEIAALAEAVTGMISGSPRRSGPEPAAPA